MSANARAHEPERHLFNEATVHLHELLDVVRRRWTLLRLPVAKGGETAEPPKEPEPATTLAKLFPGIAKIRPAGTPQPDFGEVQRVLSRLGSGPAKEAKDVHALADDLVGALSKSNGEALSKPNGESTFDRLINLVQPTGVAFSGGGIRSASFCLGFLQALTNAPTSGRDGAGPGHALDGVDYLSTVSGGGYTGGMLSALAARCRSKKSNPACSRDLTRVELTEPNAPSKEEELTRRNAPDEQRFWTRILHRGQGMGQLLPFLSRHVASTLVFNLALLSGLTCLCALIALVWRELDRPPLHTFFGWASNDQVLEYNRPLLIPLAMFTCYLIVALSRWECPWGLRATALSVPMILFGAWLGLPYFVILSLVLTVVLTLVTLLSGALRKRSGPGTKQAAETRRVAGALAMLIGVGLGQLFYMAFLIATVRGGYPTGHPDMILSYPQLAAWTGAMVVLQIGWMYYLAMPQFRQNHLKLDKVLLALTGLCVLAAVAVWVSTPNMNFGWADNSLWAGSRSVLQVAAAAILALLLPFVRLETVLRSGMKARSTVERRVFNLLSGALLLGVPFLVISALARHDMSGYAGKLPRDLSPGDVNWEAVLRRMWTTHKVDVASHAVPSPDAATLNEFLVQQLDKRVPTERALLEPGSYVNPWSGRRVYPEWLTDFVEQTRVAVPVNPESWTVQNQRFLSDQRLCELASGVLRDPAVVLAMLRSPAVVRDIEASIKAVEALPGTDAQTVKFKENAHQLKDLLLAVRPEAADDQFAQQVRDAAAAERAAGGRIMAKPVRENLETIGLLAFTTVNHDLPDTKPFGFASRPVSIERDQLYRLAVFVLTALLFLAALVTVDLNWASPLSFYRRQLRDAYLAGQGPRDTNKDPEPDVRYGPELAAVDNVALGLPYHLIGCSVDVAQLGQEPRRRVEYFLFSRRYCGATALGGPRDGEDGYCSTVEYTLRDEARPGGTRPVRLGDVIAISGAAVSPLRVDNWLMRMVLTVTNFRLGQWLPHPCQKAPVRSTLLNMANDWPGWDDTMFGNPLVFVADGGFFDNLGLEALLDRRCRTVVVVDAGADPNFTFADLTRVIQRVSLRGITITGPDGGPLELAHLLPRNRKDEDGDEAAPQTDGGPAGFLSGLLGSAPPDVGTFHGRLSKEHFVAGLITYPDRSTGRLLYVKPTLTGDEPTELLTFRKAQPVFPHHSTVEQLFDWTMVDAYRRLGRHAGEKGVIPEFLNAVEDNPPVAKEGPLDRDGFRTVVEQFRSSLLNELTS
jgi:hypothetical protein